MLVVALAFIASAGLAQQRRDTLPARDTTDARDRVDDLNADAVKGGAFPGSFVIPGTEVSLAIGGFIKAVGFYDSEASDRLPDFFPGEDLAPDENGGGMYAMTAGLSRVFLDTRARTRRGDVRGYLEIDFNGPSVTKLRHAYLRLRNERIEVNAGQTWSTFMNSGVKPPMMGESKLSGITEIRQAQIRFTDHLSKTLHLSAAVENPSSNDVGGAFEQARTPAPDAMASLALERGKLTRVELSGLARRLQVLLADGSTPSATAWGAQLSAVIEPKPQHKLRVAGLVGDGIGRYLQGLDPAGAGFVSPDGDIDTRRAWGASASWEQPWSESLRSVFAAGTANVDAPTRSSGATSSRRTFCFGRASTPQSPWSTSTASAGTAARHHDTTTRCCSASSSFNARSARRRTPEFRSRRPATRRTSRSSRAPGRDNERAASASPGGAGLRRTSAQRARRRS